jgi:uncharacterized repeat protein (TIGR03803 family)
MRRFARTSLVLSTLVALTVVAAQAALAQTFTVLHNFTGGQDGANPTAGLTMDRGGNLYGTANVGGYMGGYCGNFRGCGTVFKMTHTNGGWLFTPLYNFTGDNDGAVPEARVIIGPNGTLYGTTIIGGGSGCNSGDGCGTIFNLKPSPTACKAVFCRWTDTVLYSVTGGSGGANPELGDLVFDQAGNIYGTTTGGAYGQGIVFELTPSNGGWTERTLYHLGSDMPVSGVIFDKSGNLYGTTSQGGIYGFGMVYELTPSGDGWVENTLYSFQGGSDGENPWGGLIFDDSGNLYGTTVQGGIENGGTLFELTFSNGNWAHIVLYVFTPEGSGGGYGPTGSLIMDAAGSLYGMTYEDGAYGSGLVFKLTPSGGSWTYTSLHDFTGGSDGCGPYGNLTFDANGSLYGTTYACGEDGYGVVFEITP